MLPTPTRRQRGITLIEIILVCAIITAAAAGLFVFAKKTSVNAAVEKEQRQVKDIVKTVDSMFALQPNFAALGTNGAEYLSTRGASRSGLNLTKEASGAAALTTGLGSGQLNLAAWTVNTGTGPAVPNSGYRLAYQGLTANECSRLVTATYPIAHKVSVAHSALDDTAAAQLALRGQLTATPDIVTNNCGEGSPTVFLYFAPARAIHTPPAATPSSRPAPVCNPTREVQQIPCPAGQIGTITQERTGDCSGVDNAFVYTTWTTISNTCGATVTPPPTVPVTPTADNCTVTTFTEVGTCPAGQTGQVIRRRTLDTCTGAYTPWVVDASVSNCQTMPVATCVPQDDEQTLACAPGQTGSITQVRSSTCSSPTATPVWSAWETVSDTCRGNATCSPQRENGPVPCAAGYYGPWMGDRERFRNCVNATTQGGWSTWNILVPNTSCTACPANTTETGIDWQPASASCPSGQSGSITWERERVRTRTRSYACPEGTTALPAETIGSWSGYSYTGAERNYVNSCVNNCVAPASTTATRTQSCPSGQTGVITESQTTSWSCPSPTGSPVSSTSAWTVTSNTCASTCSPPPSTTATRTQSCPSGQTGVITESQTTSWSCPSPTGSPVSSTSAWTVVSNTCAATCTAPAPTTTGISRPLSNQGRDVGCPAGQTGNHWQTRTVTESGTRTTSWACPGPTSSTTETWSGSYTYGAWTTTSNTCQSSLQYFWEIVVLRADAGGTQSDRTQYQVFSVTGMDTLPSSCWQNPPSGNLWTWRGGGYFPGFYDNRAGCGCDASRVGWQVSWNQSEYFAYDEDYQLICVAR